MDGLNIDLIKVIDEKSGLELFMQYSYKRDIDIMNLDSYPLNIDGERTYRQHPGMVKFFCVTLELLAKRNSTEVFHRHARTFS